jgi:dephospho-CoA kinase
MVKLGLTGGIGSGKSTVAQLLAGLGAAVIDADATARALTASGGMAMGKIVEVFGRDYVMETGAMDRDRMRGLVFSDPVARKQLEAIIHPLVKLQTEEQVSAATKSGRQCLVFDIPLLVESKTWRPQLDLILVIDCPHELQISRVMARNELSRSQIEKIIASQVPRAARLTAADVVIFNTAISLDMLADEVRQISHRFGLSCA